MSAKIIVTLLTTLLLLLSAASNALANEEFVSVTAYNGEPLEISVVSMQKAREYFEYVKKQKNIPHGLIADGCHVRAQQMADLARLRQIQVAKAVVEITTPEKLIIKSSEGPWRALWDYHIAPVVFVRDSEGNSRPYIVDPALFPEPVSRTAWLQRIFKDSPEQAVSGADVYFVSRFTFRPSMKMQVFTELPRRIDVSMPQMLSGFKWNLNNLGPFYENCIATTVDGQETIGGLEKTLVPGFENYKYCEFAGM